MAVYRYKARDSEGKAIVGTVEAPSIELAGGQLDNLGYIPITIKEEAAPSTGLDIGRFFSGGVKTEDMVMFTFQMSTLIGAGIPLLSCLKILGGQTKNDRLKKIIAQAGKEVEGGSSLSESLSRHSKVFPEIYINMIKAGEASGKLQEIFARLGEMVEHEAETREKIKSATRYPKMVLIALGLAFIVVVSFVIPKFVSIFERFRVALPLPTRILIALNTIFHNYWYVGIGGVVFIMIFYTWYIKTSGGRLFWDTIKIRVPVLGPLFLKVAMSRFTHILGMLNQSGIPIIENLRIVSLTVGNSVIAKVIDSLREGVHEGRGLAETMKEHKIFPPLVVQMVSVGENSGALDEVLLKISRYYDMEVEHSTKNLSTYIEPFLILVLGVILLFFALSIFLPMWDLTNFARM